MMFNSPETLTAAERQPTDMWSSCLFVERLPSCQTVLDLLNRTKKNKNLLLTEPVSAAELEEK